MTTKNSTHIDRAIRGLRNEITIFQEELAIGERMVAALVREIESLTGTARDRAREGYLFPAQQRVREMRKSIEIINDEIKAWENAR